MVLLGPSILMLFIVFHPLLHYGHCFTGSRDELAVTE